MACCHHFALHEGGDAAFAVDPNAIVFGPGVLGELGDHARILGMRRVALFTDPRLARLEPVARARASLAEAGLDAALYAECRVEPTDESFRAAAAFAREGGFDGYVSVGGGSVMDTAKAANLYASHPAEPLAYVNAPIGEGRAVPGPLAPHVACPTTCGTGSECTGIAVFDLLAMKAKTGIASPRLRPTLALIDPLVTHSLPASVVAASGFDVLSHALESYTARPFTARPAPARASARPMSQGANPWSDIGCREALRLAGRYLVRAVTDESDLEARERLIWAATLAGIAFGNAGCHLPHGMSYSVSGLVRDFRPAGYPDTAPIVPHGYSVIVNAPAAFRFTGPACPARHLEAARALGAEVRDAAPEDAGAVVADHLIAMMKAAGMPNGVGGVGYGPADIGALTEGAFPQRRLLDNAPRAVGRDDLAGLYADAMRYWEGG